MTHGGSSFRIFSARAVATLALFLALCEVAVPAGPPRAKAPTEPIDAIIEALTAEAIALVKNKDVPKGEPDYAHRATLEVTREIVGMALTKPTHRDPFVDAYVRWQLTSFDPVLPEMDDRAFAQFMDSAPRLLENPQADKAALDLFERAENAGKLPQRDVDRLRATWLELQQRSKVVELMNRPADEFREFIADNIGENGLHPRLWLLENCVATIQGGWSTRSVKTKITKSFTAAATDAMMNPAQLRLLAAQTRKLADMNRKYISDLTLFADGKVDVSFSTAGVTDKDVEKWINRLAGVP